MVTKLCDPAAMPRIAAAAGLAAFYASALLAQQQGPINPQIFHSQAVSPTPNSWSIGTPMPTSRQGPFTGAIGQKIYVVGGQNTSTVGVNEVYDTVTDTWTTAAPMLTPRVVGASAVVNNVLYAIGGITTGSTAASVVEAYDPATNTWSTKAPMPITNDSIYATVANGIIYVIGGYEPGQGRLSSALAYNPAGDAWSTLAPLKVGKSLPAIGVIGSTIIAAGGLANSGATTDNEGYDMTRNTWTTLAPLPTARTGGCFGVFGTMLYLAGGNGNAGTQLTSMEAYDANANTWSTGLPPMPNGVVNPGSAILGGRLYCFGGSNQGSSPQREIFNYVQIYQPTASLSVNAFGTVNNASFASGSTPLAPGTIAAVFGTSLDDGSMDAFSSFGADGKLIDSLAGASVTFSGVPNPIPIFSAFPQQLNVEIPQELAGATSATIQVTVNGQTSAPQFVPIGPFSPGIFTIPPGGTGQGAIKIANSATYAAPEDSVPGSLARPAKIGEFISIFCTGLGAVTTTPATGAPAPPTPPTTIDTPQVTIGGVPAKVSFSGLAPGFVGLYQVNVKVPSVAGGDAVPLLLSTGGVHANAVTVAIGN
jgi:uncharacterized protein (TIGR03437 family)